jgi:hypothetical protein
MMSVEQSVEWELAGETEVLGENLPPVPLCPPQIQHNLTWARTQGAALGSWRLTAWAMARPDLYTLISRSFNQGRLSSYFKVRITAILEYWRPIRPRILLQKLTVTLLVMVPAFVEPKMDYRIHKIRTLFISWAKWIQSTSYNLRSILMSSSRLSLVLACGLFCSGSPTTILYAYVIFISDPTLGWLQIEEVRSQPRIFTALFISCPFHFLYTLGLLESPFALDDFN